MQARLKQFKERQKMRQSKRRLQDKDVKRVGEDNEEDVKEGEGTEVMTLSFEDLNKGEDLELSAEAKRLMREYSKEVRNIEIAVEQSQQKKNKQGYNIVVEKNGKKFVVEGCLDSRADTSAAARNKFEKYCVSITKLDDPTKVKVADGARYLVTHKGEMKVRLCLGKGEEYDFGMIQVLLVNEVKNWTNLLIGNDLLEMHGLSPLQALKRRAKNCQNVEVAKEGVMSHWFEEKVLTKKKDRIKVKRVEIRGAEFENKKKDPVIFKAYDDEVLKKEHGLGENLEVSFDEDILRMKQTICEKFAIISKDGIFSKGSLEKIKRIILTHAQGFGDDKSPTRISVLEPIRCEVKNEEEVGVCTARSMGPEKEDFLRGRINQMLKANIIKPNRNPTISMQSLVVPKAVPKKYRFVVDFRPLNHYTRKVDSTLPDITNQLAKVKGKKLFGQYDLLSGFDYLPTHKESQRFFTFCTPWGLCYSFQGAPQGWCNTPSLFSERIIREVLEPVELFSRNALQWIDDNVILGTTFEEFCEATEKFLRQVIHKNLRLNVSKCDFIKKEAVFCGHLLTEKGHRLDKKYAADLLGRRKPKYVHELAQLIFIGNWIAGILPHFSRIRFTLTEKYSIVGKIKALERKKEIIIWTKEMNDAYQELCAKLQDSFEATLGYFDATLDVVLSVDASKRHWVYFICQTDEKMDENQILDTQFKVIAMSSGTFIGSALDWHISSKELYPVIAASKKYDYYLKGNSVRKILFTDHRNLVYILNPSLCRKKAYSERLSHWSVIFQDFQLEVHHINGDCNIAADALSRWLNPDSKEDQEERELLCIYNLQMDMEEVTMIDDFWKKIDEMHLSWRSPNCTNSWPVMDEGYLLELQRKDLGERITEVQRRDNKLLVTPSLIPSILMDTHLKFNHGSAEAEKRVLEKEYVPVDKDVANLLMEGWVRFRRQCVHCQRPVKVMRRPFNITTLAKRCREVLLSDFLYLSKKEGYLLTEIDSLSRLTVLHKCKNADASAVVQGLWKFHSYYELAEDFVLASDKGSHFVNQVVTTFIQESGGSQKFSCAYAPYTNGATEVQNRQIHKHFRTLVSELSLTVEQWPILIHRVQYYLNASSMRSRGGLTPFQIFMGKIPRKDALGKNSILDFSVEQDKQLQDLVLDLQEEIEKYQERAFTFAYRARQYQNALYNKKYKLTPLHFSEGDFVLVSKAVEHEKLRPQWIGPYIVKKQISEHLYEVATIMGQVSEIHSSRLMHFAPSEFLPNPGTKVAFLNDSGRLEVKCFKGLKENAGGFLVRIEWRGFADEDDWTWEPVNIIFEDLPKMLMNYSLKERTKESQDVLRYLKVVYPEGWKWEEFELSEVRVKDVQIRRVEYDLEDCIVEKGWTVHQENLLNSLVKHFGFANYDMILKYMPGRNRQQIYTKLQSWINVQAIGDYTNLKLDLNAVREKNQQWFGKEYKIEKRIRSVVELEKRRWWTRWKFERMHTNLNEFDNRNEILVVHDWNNLSHMKARMKLIIKGIKGEKIEGKIYPEISKNLDGELEKLSVRISELMRQQKLIVEERNKIQRIYELICFGQIVLEDMPCQASGVKINWGVCNNSIELSTTRVKVLRWLEPKGAIRIKGDVFDFLDKYVGKPFDVVVIDPPYKFCSKDSIRGPSNNFNQVNDKELVELNLKRVVKNSSVFVWTFWGKRDLTFQLINRWGLKYVDHLLWIKTTRTGKIRSTLGNLTLKCVEELLICRIGELPKSLKSRNFGKEVLMAPSSGNCRKPKEVYEVIEKCFGKNARYLDLFARKNNLRAEWTSVGEQL
eukprot:snap_masked-scaffold_30-processed-gene-3.44-mRNA-1 protein AED:0.49 eAED:0.50 QI:0/-1/0/1/-1/1/1/0/1792